MKKAALALTLPGQATPISLFLPSTVTWTRAEEVFTLLGTIGRASPWWVADAYLWAEKKFGESKATQLAEKFNLEPGTLTNIVSVGSRVALAQRRASLSFGHHADIAKFTPAVQTQWLDKAEQHGWTRAELRKALKPASESGPDPPHPPHTCSQCEATWTGQ